jgi:hypothetical protein
VQWHPGGWTPLAGQARPGGGTPHVPPVGYQVTALRQIIAKISETMTEFTFPSLRAVLLNYPRTGTDPVYDPLGPSSCTEGLARLTGLGEIEQLGEDHHDGPHLSISPRSARTRALISSRIGLTWSTVSPAGSGRSQSR